MGRGSDAGQGQNNIEYGSDVPTLLDQPGKNLYPHVGPRLRDINIEKLRHASAKRGFNHKHLRSISNIVGSRKSSNINELVSPYSILRQQDEGSVEDAL